MTIKNTDLEDLTNKEIQVNIDEVTPQDLDDIAGGFLPAEEGEGESAIKGHDQPSCPELASCFIYF